MDELRGGGGELFGLDVDAAAVFGEKVLGDEWDVLGDLTLAEDREKLLKANSSTFELSY